MTDPELKEILAATRIVAVVGWSPRPDRPSHWIADYLDREAGYRVFRINPRAVGAEGIEVWPDLTSLPEAPDLVDVFRAPPAVPAIVAEAAAAGARVVWLQPGAENDEAAAEARRLGMTAVVGECLYATHRRLAG